jgi:hypothetical protein
MMTGAQVSVVEVFGGVGESEEDNTAHLISLSHLFHAPAT